MSMILEAEMISCLYVVPAVVAVAVNVREPVKLNVLWHSGDRKHACMHKASLPNWNAFGRSEGMLGTVKQGHEYFHISLCI